MHVGCSRRTPHARITESNLGFGPPSGWPIAARERAETIMREHEKEAEFMRTYSVLKVTDTVRQGVTRSRRWPKLHGSGLEPCAGAYSSR